MSKSKDRRRKQVNKAMREGRGQIVRRYRPLYAREPRSAFTAGNDALGIMAALLGYQRNK